MNPRISWLQVLSGTRSLVRGALLRRGALVGGLVTVSCLLPASAVLASPAAKIYPTPTPKGCPAPTGRLTGSTLGRLKLGMTRAQSDRSMPQHTSIGYGFENHCLANGPGIRVAFGSPQLRVSIAQGSPARFSGRIVLALTGNKYYTLGSIRPGTPLAKAKRELKLGQAIHVGLNYWYVATAPGTNKVLKVRNGIAQEIGIATKALTNTPAAQRQFFTHI